MLACSLIVEYIRVLLAMKKFDWSDMDDVFVHATNCSVQQRHPQYDAIACNKPLSVRCRQQQKQHGSVW